MLASPAVPLQDSAKLNHYRPFCRLRFVVCLETQSRDKLPSVDAGFGVLLNEAYFGAVYENHPESRNRWMHRAIKVILGWFPFLVCVLGVASAPGYGVTIAEVAAKIRSLNQQERINYLFKGAQAEGELAYYGTLPIDEFLPLARVFNGRYRSMALQHYFSPRDGILSRSLTEARAGRHAVDVIQVDLSYGYQLLNAKPGAPVPYRRSESFLRGHVRPQRFLAQHVLLDHGADLQH